MAQHYRRLGRLTGMTAAPKRIRAAPSRGRNRDDPLATIYIEHFRELIRLAALLVDNVAEAEEIAQEAYLRTARARRRPDDPLAYLRQAVVNLSRSALRRRLVARRLAVTTSAAEPIDESPAQTVTERDAIMRPLRSLPRRTREVLVLRYYLDLSVAQTAELLGISGGSVTSYTSRGLTQLATLMEET